MAERRKPLTRSEQAALYDLAKRVKCGDAAVVEIVRDRTDGRLVFRVAGETNVKA